MILRFLRFISILALVLGFGAGALFLWLQNIYTEPGPLQKERVVLLPKGANVRAISEILRQEGVIGNELIFEFGARLSEKSRLLKAGEYAFAPGVSMRQVVDILVEGKTVAHRLTVAEGLVVREVVDLINERKGLNGDPLTVLPPEGSLLPETYHFNRGGQPAGVAHAHADGYARDPQETLG